MSETWQRTRHEVVQYGRRLQAEHLCYFTSGNISARIPDEATLLAVTPTSIPYDALEPEDICIVRTSGEIVEARWEPSSELPMHTLICARRPEVRSVIHTHSAAAMTMANLGWELPPIVVGLVEAVGGSVRSAPYSRPGTAEMADLTAEALVDRGACFMRFHGLLAVGADLSHAYRTAAVVEEACEVYLRLRRLGEVHELPASEVALAADTWKSQFATPAEHGVAS
jgi:L-fuculose-phosphate aldolase